ncbi:hypothetical protein CYY_009409 [Polysphondylium violaceum]|uniref:PH domain-containing protein n=1 Tax=Polysphondylium violaceum TaxID=133409 RepID=A0A8J4PLR7_9MYCE|nr:hypothetical protein CYY_009409 [Polysphondylium violaceum]
MDSQLKQEVVDLTKAVLATFTTEYTKAYTAALVSKCIKDAKKPPSPYLLEQRPKDFVKDDIFSGYLVKEGAVRKSWLRRYFVCRWDYSVDYFVEENMSVKKGSINLSGYRVEEDPNKSTLGRIMKLAEKMGIDVSAIPKPKEYPPFTIELFHSSRRCYYIQCKSPEEFKEWCDIFKVCCRKAWGLKNRDPVHVAAFPIAIRNTRWSLGRYGWGCYGGSEVQVLADMISDEIEYDILSRALGKLPSGPWFVRNWMRNSMMKVIDGIVNSAVNPAWIGMDKTVSELRPTLEPKIKNEIDPIIKIQNEIQSKMKDSLMSIIEPALKQHAAQHLTKIIGGIKGPIENGFNESIRVFKEKTNGYQGDGSPSSFTTYRAYPNSYYIMNPSREKVSEIYKTLDPLHSVFSNFSSYWIGYEVKDEIVNMAYNGTYTFEKSVNESKDVSLSNSDTLEKYLHDTQVGSVIQIKYVVKEVIRPTLVKVVDPLCKPIVSSMASAIPSSFKELIDINQMYQQLIDDVINDTTHSVLEEI